MAFRFMIVAVFALVCQANAGCIGFPPPPCACGAPALPSLEGLLPSLLGALPARSPLAGLLPSLGLPGCPAALPCAVPPTKVTNKPDVNIPLPLPSEIPIGRFCSCQKFAIKPALVPCTPCAPPPPPCALPLPLPPPCGGALPPALLQNLLGALGPSPCTCL